MINVMVNPSFISLIMNETWVHHFQPESKEQSKQWKHHGLPAPKKAKSVISAGKVMASIFWDSQGVILVGYLTKGQSITGQYYANLLRQLQEKIKKNWHGKLSLGFWLWLELWLRQRFFVVAILQKSLLPLDKLFLQSMYMALLTSSLLILK